MPHNAHIAIADLPQQNALLLRCEGRCTMGICPTLKSTLHERTRDAVRHIYIDLSNTEAIDSTFTGFLLTLRPHRDRPDAPAVHLVAPTPNVMRTLETMQVSRLLDVVDALPASDINWQPIVAASGDPKEAGEIIIEAHESLIEADERNREEFGRVVEGFRKDQERNHGSHN